MTDYEKLRLHAARFAYRRRNQKTPSGKSTWGEWFQDRFKMTLDEFKERQKRKAPIDDNQIGA